MAILQAWPRIGIWIRDNREQIQPAVRAGLELGVSEIQVHRSNSSEFEWENYSLVSNRYVSQGLYQSLLLWKTVVLTSFQKPQLHYPLQSSSSLSIRSSFCPFFYFFGWLFFLLSLSLVTVPTIGMLANFPSDAVQSPKSSVGFHSWDYVVLFNWMHCTLFSPSIGVKFELSQFDNPSFNFDL